MVEAMTITARQYVVLHLYYCLGNTQRQIAVALGISQKNVHMLLVRGRRWIIESATEGMGGISSPLIRGLLQPSPTASVTGHAGNAALRQEELLDTLDLRMQQRSKELADIEECMSCDSIRPTQRNGVGRGGVSIGPSGTSWPPEKWQPPGQGQRYGTAHVLPCDEPDGSR